MRNVEVDERMPVVNLKESASMALRLLLAYIPPRRISVGPLSEEWCRQHERDAVKK